MKVRARETGFYAGERKKPGAVFFLPPGAKPAKWMQVLEAPEQPKAEKPAEEVKAKKPKAEKPAEEKAE